MRDTIYVAMAKQYNRQVSTHDKPDHDKSAYNGTGGGRLGKDAYSHVLETRSQLCNTVNLLSTHIDPAKISPKNVLALQRYLGNRAVTSLFAKRDIMSVSDKQSKSSKYVLQRKKTEIKTLEERKRLAQTWNFLPEKSKIDGSLSENERTNLMMADLDQIYQSHLVKGKKYLDTLEEAKKQYFKSPLEYVKKKQKQRDIHNANFAKNYVTSVTNSDNDSSTTARKVSSSGFVGERPSKPKENVYYNIIDPWEGRIRALDNYATKDEARKEDDKNINTEGYKKKGLPNSEVLWQQGLASAKSQLWFPWFYGDSRAKKAMGGVKSMRRENIQNPLTRAVVFMSYPNGKVYWVENMTWQKDSEEFEAVMGTPNAAPAIHMLTDHLDEIQHKNIADVTATTSEHLLIQYDD